MSKSNSRKSARVPGNNKSRKASTFRSFVMPGSNASILGAAVITAMAYLLVGYFGREQKANVPPPVPRTQPLDRESNPRTPTVSRLKRPASVSTRTQDDKRKDKQPESSGVAAMPGGCSAQDLRLRRCFHDPEEARAASTDTEDPL